MPANVMALFAVIAREDASGTDLSFTDISLEIDMPIHGVSRNARVLATGEAGRGESVGHGLIEIYRHPVKPVYKCARLTPRGRAFMRSISLELTI